MSHSFFDLAASRRSIRRFTGEPVSDQDVDEILKTALEPVGFIFETARVN